MKKLIVLDRDGVINEDSDEYVKSVHEWIPLPGSIEAIADLARNGWTICIATNQSGIARGYFDEDTLHAMHEKLHALLAEREGQVHDIFFCPHGPEDNCDCRKPAAGLIDQVIAKYGDVTGCPMVGDSKRDLEAGIARGMMPVLVKTGKGAKTVDKVRDMPGIRIHDDLAAFVRELLAS